MAEPPSHSGGLVRVDMMLLHDVVRDESRQNPTRFTILQFFENYRAFLRGQNSHEGRTWWWLLKNLERSGGATGNQPFVGACLVLCLFSVLSYFASASLLPSAHHVVDNNLGHDGRETSMARLRSGELSNLILKIVDSYLIDSGT